MIEFPHKAPHGYSYEFVNFKKNVIAIWIVNHFPFSYTDESVRSIWGFYNTKTKCYHSPVNSKTVGKIVNFEDTTRYSAMQIKQTPLTAAFV
jgi:hypothetical protein